MLLTMKELLRVAKKNHFAVGAFNIADSELFKCVIAEAEASQAPVIVELAPPEFDYAGADFLAYVRNRLIKSSVPCVLHLDHGKTIADCIKAIQCGFSSVMIDGSQLSYKENVELSAKVVELAHMVGISVEGEIGTIGALDDSSEGGAKNVIYTQPSDVTDFLSKTGLDTLAIAIGTAHGIYPKDFVPELKLDLLKEIRQVTDAPLVLHGGSANKDEEVKAACQLGIQKVNIASDYRKAFFTTVQKTLNDTRAFWSPDVYEAAINAARQVIHHKMELFGCIGKAKCY